MINLTADAPLARIPEQFREHPDVWAEVCRRLKHDPNQPLRILGKGSHGTAYLLNPDIVLKITEDTVEASAMKRVMNNPTDLVVQVYAIYEVREPKDTFLIIQERLQPPLGSWQAFADQLGDFIFETNGALNTTTLENFIASKPKPAPTEEQLVWAEDVANYLKSIRVRFKDVHGQNIMRKPDGQHCLIDLGYSNVPRTRFKFLANLLMDAAEAVE